MKGIITKGLEDAYEIEHSPKVRALAAGSAGALVGGAIGGGIGALSGTNPFFTGFLGALMLGGITGAAEALTQNVKNQEREAMLRFHLDNLKSREPYFFDAPVPAVKAAPKQKKQRGMPLYVY